MSQTAPSKSANSRFIHRSWAKLKHFNRVQIRTLRWFSIHLRHGSDELEHCRQPTCFPIPGKNEFQLLPKCGYSPTNCFFRVLWWGPLSHCKQWYPPKNKRGSFEDDNVQRGLRLSLWLQRTQPDRRCVTWICTSLKTQTASSNRLQAVLSVCTISIFLALLWPLASVSWLLLHQWGGKKAFRARTRRSVQCETVLSGLKLLNSVCSFWMLRNQSFCTFLSWNLSSRFDSFFSLPLLGFGKTVPLATKLSHMVQGVEGFSNLAACKWLDRRTLLASAQ